MLSAIVPVKPLQIAKGRLSSVLGAAERQALVLAMLGDVLAALLSARLVDQVSVVSHDSTILSLAREHGAEALRDHAGDLNGALTQAARHYAQAGAAAVLLMHADLPLATPAEIDELVGILGRESGAALASARDGGTNALLVRPPLVLPFQFGAGSQERHLRAAHERGIDVRLLRSPGLELDVDRPDDLLLLAESPGTTAAQRLVRDLDIAARMTCV
jgi:2-phospho-L-lactate guanylyltransferase